jgi:hypothetical protein
MGVAIMPDDRGLVERLAAIDATPRASWVAELRADLDAAWETGDVGYPDSLRPTTLALVDHEPTPSEPSSSRRWPTLIAVAAAAVVAIVLVVIRNDEATPADQPSPTATVPPTLPPRALSDSSGWLLPGTYFVDEVEKTPTPRILFTIGTGYRNDGGRVTDNLFDFRFSRPGAVFSNACHWEDGYHPGPLTTVDALVAALSEQGGWAEVTAPSNVVIDGYAGTAFQRTAPADITNCDTYFFGRQLQPLFASWQLEAGDWAPASGNLAGFAYGPGHIESLVVLDIDGTIVVISSRPIPYSLSEPEPSLTLTSGAVSAEFAAVLDSIRIERT